MRTKHLFYAIALAGAFSACTQDEFEAVNTGEALSSRKLLGDVTLLEAPETRWDVSGLNIKPKTGDAMSLLLVDKMNTGLAAEHDYAIDNYTLSDQVWSNFMFKYGATGWSGDAKLVEGNYLFVAPAQETLERNTIEITMPTEQNLTNAKVGENSSEILEAFAESGAPVLIGHRFLSLDEPDDRYTPEMENIFAYPRITVKNPDRAGSTAAGNAVVTRVVIKSTNKKFPVRSSLDLKKAARLLTNEVFTKQGTDTKNQVLVGAWSGNMDAHFGSTKYASNATYKQGELNADGSTKNLPNTFDVTLLKADGTGAAQSKYLYKKGLTVAKTADLILGETIAESDYIVINVNGDQGIELAPQQSFSFNAIMPADVYNDYGSGYALAIYVYLKNGQMYKKEFTTGSSSIDMYPGKQYPLQDYEVSLKKRADALCGMFFTVGTSEGYSDSYGTTERVDGDPLEMTSGFVYEANSQDKLKKIISGHSNANDLTIVVTSDKVAYNEEINNLVGAKSCQHINFLGAINIEGTSTWLSVDQRVHFEKATITSGYADIWHTGSWDGEYTVLKGAALNLGGSSVKKVTNYGYAYLGAYILDVYNMADLYLYNGYDATATSPATPWDAAWNDGNGNYRRVHNGYEACYDEIERCKYQSEVLSNPISYSPSVTLENTYGTTYQTAYVVKRSIDYPITIKSFIRGGVKYPARLQLADDVEVVENGSISNNGKIEGATTAEKLTIGQEATMYVDVEGEVTAPVIVKGASATPCPVADYKQAGTVTNAGTISNNMSVDGLLTMLSGSHVTGDIYGSGEIDNTAIGDLAGTTITPAVFAKITDPVDASTSAARNAIYAKWKNQWASIGKVTEYRLFNEIYVGAGQTYTTSMTGTLVFCEGSSLRADAGTFTTNWNISVRAKNVPWYGFSTARTTFSLTGTSVAKGFYRAISGSTWDTFLGNVKSVNCGVAGSLN